MFENIIGQEDAVIELMRDVEKSKLPASLLFHGPELSGKLTTAIELGRVLMCGKKTAEWNCDCLSCTQNRVLENPYLLMLGGSNFVEEIRAASDVLSKADSIAARYLLVRAVRKLTRRYDGVLWEGAENRIASLLEPLAELEESIVVFLPESPGVGGGELQKKLKEIVELSASIGAKTAADSIPIHQVRRVSYWAHATSGESPKVVIFENADRMLPGSANALLKTLEEPPADTYFVLITTKKERIIPTLKSRMRKFEFHRRSVKVQEEILRRVFKESSGRYGSLGEYFLAWSVEPDVIHKACERFLDAVKSGLPDTFFMEQPGDEAYLSRLEDSNVFRSFLTELSNELHKGYRESLESKPEHRDLKRYEIWNNSLAEHLRRLESFNMNPSLLVHSLYREIVRQL